jgi:hypothetical protein
LLQGLGKGHAIIRFYASIIPMRPSPNIAFGDKRYPPQRSWASRPDPKKFVVRLSPAF